MAVSILQDKFRNFFTEGPIEYIYEDEQVPTFTFCEHYCWLYLLFFENVSKAYVLHSYRYFF